MKYPFPWARGSAEPESRAAAPISLTEYADLLTQFSFNGVQYTLPGSPQEKMTPEFVSMSRMAYKANGVVFACELSRLLLFSEARFQFRRRSGIGRPGALFGSPALAPLENPWPGGTTVGMLKRAMQHADFGGNAYFVRRGKGVRLLRPDWVSIVVGSQSDPKVAAWDVDADVLGYIYKPGGSGSGREAQYFLPEEVAHWAPIPDPEAQFRGMSWLTPVVREVMADKAATDHKLQFFENGATPNMVVKLDVQDLDKFKQWVSQFREDYEGTTNAYRTLFLGAGADVTVAGADFKQIEFKTTQGAGETRIAAAAGTPPIIVGLSEGLASATYSNYGQARRRFADGTIRPLWRDLCGVLAQIIAVPSDAELWYDDRDIPFLQEDQKDAAEVAGMKASAMKTLVDAGYEPGTVVEAVDAGDMSLLKHTGLVSVQLLPPGTVAQGASTSGPPPANTEGK